MLLKENKVTKAKEAIANEFQARNDWAISIADHHDALARYGEAKAGLYGYSVEEAKEEAEYFKQARYTKKEIWLDAIVYAATARKEAKENNE